MNAESTVKILLSILSIQWWLVCWRSTYQKPLQVPYSCYKHVHSVRAAELVSHDEVQILMQSKYCYAGTFYISFLSSDHCF